MKSTFVAEKDILLHEISFILTGEGESDVIVDGFRP